MDDKSQSLFGRPVITSPAMTEAQRQLRGGIVMGRPGATAQPLTPEDTWTRANEAREGGPDESKHPGGRFSGARVD